MENFVLFLKWGLLAICILILLSFIINTYTYKKRAKKLQEKITDIENERAYAKNKLLALLNDLGFLQKILSYEVIKEDTFLVTLPHCMADEFIQKLEELVRIDIKNNAVPLYEIISDTSIFDPIFYDIKCTKEVKEIRQIQFREIDYSISITTNFQIKTNKKGKKQ